MSSSRASSRPRYQIHVSYVSGLQADSLLLGHCCPKLWTTKYKQTKKKKQNPNALLKSWSKNRKLEAKAGYRSMPPALNTTKGWAEHPSHPAGPAPGHTPAHRPGEVYFPWCQTRCSEISVLFMHVGSRARLSEFKSQGCRLLAVFI